MHRILVSDGAGYRVELEPHELDVDRFERLTAEARMLLAASPAAAVSRFDAALALWRGPPLADLAFEPCAQADVHRLEELRLVAEEDRLDALLAAGRHGELVGELEALVERNSLRERLRGQLLLALYRAGRQSDALKAYARARDELVEQLGVEPGPELRELHHAILTQDPSLAAPPVRAAAVLRSPPRPPTRMVGREGAVDEVTALLRKYRVVTLLGPGGVGKTRLALEIAEHAAADFPDGVAWVELETIREPPLVLTEIAGAVGADNVAAELEDHRVLLVLDNLEQVLDSAELLAELIARTAEVRLLVTSREPLDIAAERRYHVPLLDSTAAVQLFNDRADAVGVSVREDEGAVAAICDRLEGLPLAVELAAARTTVFSPVELLRRLDSAPDLLGGTRRDAPERHRTMRSTIAWSDGLLSDAERRFFHRLAVFSGGCMLEAAEAVCNPGGELGDTLTLAEKLFSASLVLAPAAPDGQRRLHLLQTIREYAAEALAADAEEDLARNRHCDYFLLLAERADTELSGPDQTRWMTLLEQEHDNFREALALAAHTPDTGQELRLVGALAFFWSVRGRHLAEGRGRLNQALARAGSASADLRAKALRQNAWIAIRQGQLDDARPLAEEAVEIYRSLGDASGTHNTLDALAAVLIETGEMARARPVLEESLALARTLGNENYVAATLNNLASLALVEQDYERARELATESLESFTELGSSYGSAIALYHIGAAQAQQGAFGQALPNLRESLRLSDELGDDEGVICCIEAVALLTAVAGEASSAARLLGCAEAVRRRSASGALSSSNSCTSARWPLFVNVLPTRSSHAVGPKGGG